MSRTVFRAMAWKSNAELIADIASLGLLRRELRTLDPTFGKGNWHTRWTPDNLVTHNRNEDGSDFRYLPYDNGTFDQIEYDPPYVSKGGRDTSGITDMDEAYGQDDAPATPQLLQDLINEGLTEMQRLVKPRRLVKGDEVGGIICVKVQNYVSGGELWLGEFETLTHARGLGLHVEEVFQHVAGTRPQPKRSRCRFCDLAILRAKTGLWGDQLRNGDHDKYVCPMAHVEGGQRHDPDPKAPTQDHAIANVSSMIVLRKRPRRSR